MNDIKEKLQEMYTDYIQRNPDRFTFAITPKRRKALKKRKKKKKQEESESEDDEYWIRETTKAPTVVQPDEHVIVYKVLDRNRSEKAKRQTKRLRKHKAKLRRAKKKADARRKRAKTKARAQKKRK